MNRRTFLANLLPTTIALAAAPLIVSASDPNQPAKPKGIAFHEVCGNCESFVPTDDRLRVPFKEHKTATGLTLIQWGYIPGHKLSKPKEVPSFLGSSYPLECGRCRCSEGEMNNTAQWNDSLPCSDFRNAEREEFRVGREVPQRRG